jgi:hypothetical protein
MIVRVFQFPTICLLESLMKESIPNLLIVSTSDWLGVQLTGSNQNLGTIDANQYFEIPEL